MNIGIDTFSFDKPGDNYGVGPGVYVWHLLPKLIEHGQEHKFYIFGNKENKELIPREKNVKIIINQLPNKVRPSRIIHEQLFVPYYSKFHNLDLVHFLGNNISYPICSKSIITIYDFMWKYYLDLGYKDIKYQYFRYTVPQSIKMARGVITISSFVKTQVNKHFHKELNRIIPVLLAPGKLIEPNIEQNKAFAEQYKYKYIFTVTTSFPHKNLIVLLKAFLQLKKNNKYNGKLVIAGQLKGNFHSSTLNFISDHNLEQDIILSGFISEELKTFLYRNADFIVYPSLYEGFGLPVLEALLAENLVIASNAASIPEAGGDACIYFNPSSDTELYEKMISVIENTNIKTVAKDKNKKHYSSFSWDKTAKETLNAYKYFLESK